MTQSYSPITLLILDGWGLSPSWGGNALAMNNPKNIDKLWRSFPHTVLQALSAIENGEVVADSHLGHTMIGAGRIVESNFARINKNIENRSFYKNEVLLGAINWAKRNQSNLHLIGLISEGGIHSHLNHLLTILNLCQREGFDRVYIDAITDGTDSGPTEALRYIEKIQAKIKALRLGRFSSVAGRYWAMDRDENWDRMVKYYQALTEPNKNLAPGVEQTVSASYRAGANDEYIEPIAIDQGNGLNMPIKDGDAVIMFNFREDRSKELERIFLDPNFKKAFWRPKRLNDLYFATFIRFSKNSSAKIAFPEKIYPNTLSEVLSKANFHQLKVAESQKLHHVTSFFNGGTEDPWPGEERKIISSPNLKSYDAKPAMASREVADAIIKAIKSRRYDFMVANFANVDMVAHTGNIIATGQAVSFVDEMVGKVVLENLRAGGITIITADHGNAEQMVQLKQNLGGQSTHTLNPVPFILVDDKQKKNLIQSSLVDQTNALAEIFTTRRTLADVAPTILELLRLPKPKEMTGKSLLNKLE